MKSRKIRNLNAIVIILIFAAIYTFSVFWLSASMVLTHQKIHKANENSSYAYEVELWGEVYAYD